MMFVLAQRDWWLLAIGLVLAAESAWLWRWSTMQQSWRQLWLGQVPALVIGVSAVLIIVLIPRLVTQIVVTIGYIGWRSWWELTPERRLDHTLVHLFITQAALFEALFLVAARWRGEAWHEWVILSLVWALTYISTYSALKAKNERAAGIMAAAWALMVVQVSWILLTWLFTYVTFVGYLLVPQPALVLVAMSYCFGSIYASARRGKLSRARLAEYLLIGLVVMAMVITGTSWKGSI